MKHTPTPEQLAILIYNAHTQPWTSLEAYLDFTITTHGRFDVATLNEVTEDADQLARWAVDHGYAIQQERPRSRVVDGMVTEEGSTALLIDRALDRVGDETLATMATRWRVFSHDQWHHPRRFQRRRVRKPNGGRWKLQADHWPTNGFDGGNRAAFAEAASRTRAWLLAKAPGTIAVAAGDKNEHAQALAAWGKPFGFKVAGHNVDHVIVSGPVEALDVEVLPKGRSDHHGVWVVITRRPSVLKRFRGRAA